MGKKSSVEWTDDTDNIIVVKGGGWWCRMISEGCGHCYAAKLNQNAFYGGNKLAYSGLVPELVFRDDIVEGWVRQKQSRLHFVSSMTDVFGDWVSREWQFKMLSAMIRSPRQIFQVLTKRPEVMRRIVGEYLDIMGRDLLPDNIWLGVSVENQQRADERLPQLRTIMEELNLAVQPEPGEETAPAVKKQFVILVSDSQRWNRWRRPARQRSASRCKSAAGRSFPAVERLPCAPCMAAPREISPSSIRGS